MKSIYLLFVLLLFPNIGYGNQDKGTLNLVTTEWCPYACSNERKGKGIVYDYLSFILAKRGITVQVEFYPWSRAIKLVEDGRRHGLLTAVHSEAPNLLFTNTPTMGYQMCFFTPLNSKWQYNGLESLQDKRLGLMADYGYGEPLDSYVALQKGSEHVFKLTGDNGLQRMLTMMQKNRLDVVIDDVNVVAWFFAKKTGSGASAVRTGGCMSNNPFFIGFSPEWNKSRLLVDWLNKDLKLRENVRMLSNKIMPNYLN